VRLEREKFSLSPESEASILQEIERGGDLRARKSLTLLFWKTQKICWHRNKKKGKEKDTNYSPRKFREAGTSSLGDWLLVPLLRKRHSPTKPPTRIRRKGERPSSPAGGPKIVNGIFELNESEK